VEVYVRPLSAVCLRQVANGLIKAENGMKHHEPDRIEQKGVRKGCEAMKVGISDAIQAKGAPHDHRYCFFFHRADNLQRVLFVVGSCHLISAPVGFEPSLLDYAGARE
jgi:hypothetical protein